MEENTRHPKVNPLKHLSVIILAFLCFGITVSKGQTIDSVISVINARYSNARKNITSYDTSRIDEWGESSEGGEAICYFGKGKMKLIAAGLFGETGRRKTGYYFDHSQLYFVLDSEYRYNRSIYYDEKMAKENNDTAFDDSKTIVNENKLYFSNGHLIKWIVNNKKEIASNDSEFSDKEKEMIEEADSLKKKFQKVR
jgi:hypothetical protein